MKLPSCPRTLIINILRSSPDGLTLTSIAKLTGLHRHTATKYIYELKGAGIINERDIGSAKLCYLKKGFSKEDEKRIVSRLNGTGKWKERKKVNDREKVSTDTFRRKSTFKRKSSTGQVQILTLFLFLFLIPATVIIAQNATQTINSTLNITGLVLGENWTENITAENISADIYADQNLSISDVTNETQAITVHPENFTLGNATANETIVNGTTLTEENDSENQEESNITSPETSGTVTIEPQNPILYVRIVSPERIIRGDIFDVSAVVTNSGNAEAKNVRMSWEIPPGFEIVLGEISSDCGSVLPDSECMASLALSSSISTDIGKSEFKVKVNYEK